MLRFAEEIMLLLLDDGGGKFTDLPALSVEYALAGAVLMDLALEKPNRYRSGTALRD